MASDAEIQSEVNRGVREQEKIGAFHPELPITLAVLNPVSSFPSEIRGHFRFIKGFENLSVPHGALFDEKRVVDSMADAVSVASSSHSAFWQSNINVITQVFCTVSGKNTQVALDVKLGAYELLNREISFADLMAEKSFQLKAIEHGFEKIQSITGEYIKPKFKLLPVLK